MNTKSENLKVEATNEKKENLPARRERILSPSVDVYENEKEVVFVVDLPGVNEENLDITLEKGNLILEGRVSLSVPSEYRKEYTEHHVDVYRRKFQLGRVLDAENAIAKLIHGQLRLTIPKQEPQKKKIQITNG